MDVWFSAGLGWTWLVASLLLLLLGLLAGVSWWRSKRRFKQRAHASNVALLAREPSPSRPLADPPRVASPATPKRGAEPEPAASTNVRPDFPSGIEGLPSAAVAGSVEVVEIVEVAEAAAVAEPTRSPTRHPLVLVHGVLGFDRVRVGGIHVNYFRGVTDELRRNGFEVHVVRVDPLAPIPVRAAQLAEQVLALGVGRVNLVAHSMGGLDARYALAHLGLEACVASLTTIGTPHRGTPVADHGTRWLGDMLGLRRVAERFGAEVEGFWELTTHRMERFNAEVPDVNGVWYASVVSEGRSANPLLRVTQGLLQRGHGASDGLVPTDSQRWGTVVDHVDADHWAQIGWGVGFDAPQLYVRLGRVLGERGL
ncbi:MAG: hypothetical protein H6718_13065 [Polyangiaceae bacterium]|nr:hypothetical protein [Myxococcales bacterium]MCB9586326.1 hypothetical protein [Polyangiaceae bacterium]MCB9607003.1 hypothetical protein [Polyangiaceae bacterium]